MTLSGGQRQRMAIARALLTDPRILILDDSTSAVDSATEDQIQRAIKRVLEGRTTLLITHRLSQIRRADKILVLHRSEIVDQGSHEELMQRCDLYRRIFARVRIKVKEIIMGFIMDGLDAEAYDREYSDRQLLKRIIGYFRPHLTGDGHGGAA